MVLPWWRWSERLRRRASDHRLGVQQTTVGNNMKKMFKVHDSLYMGLSGLATDVQKFPRNRVQDGAVRVIGKEDQAAVFRQHVCFYMRSGSAHGS